MSQGVIPGVVLLAWVPLTFWLVRNYPLPSAGVYSIVGGALFLPVRAEFDFPLIPALDKQGIPALAFMVAVYLHHPARYRFARLGRGPEAVFIACAFGYLGTWWFNRDSIFIPGWEPRVLSSLSWKDALSYMLSDLVIIVLPFCASRLIVQSLSDFRKAMRAVAFLGLLYAPLVLLEVRLSPQLHRWVYGYAALQQQFGQAIRWGGYRPNVFFPHGLGLAMFLLAVLLILAGLYRSKKLIFGLPPRWFFWGYFVVLILEKSTGAIAYAIIVLPLIFFTPPFVQRWSILTLMILALSYSTLMASLPRHELAEAVAAYSPDRAQSLQFRFDNEDLLYERAQQRFWFGWGGYGRNRVYHPEYGIDLTVTDGAWIVRLGQFGYVGMLLVFLLLVLPTLAILRRLKRHRVPQEERFILAVTFYVALSCVELIPNGMLSFCIPFVFAGMLYGLARGMGPAGPTSVRA